MASVRFPRCRSIAAAPNAIAALGAVCVVRSSEENIACDRVVTSFQGRRGGGGRGPLQGWRGLRIATEGQPREMFRSWRPLWREDISLALAAEIEGLGPFSGPSAITGLAFDS